MKNFACSLALALLAACGGSQKPKTAAAPTCADASANAEAVIAADTAGGAEMAELAPKVHALVDERCPADGWSAEVIACAAGAPTHDALHECIHQLTPEQHDKFHAGVEAALGHEMMMKHEEHEAGEADGMKKSKAAAPSDPCGGGE